MKKFSDISSNIKKIIKTILYVFQISFTYDKLYFICFIPIILINAASPFIIVVFPKLIIDAIVNTDPVNNIITLAALMFGIRLVLSTVSTILASICDRRIIHIRAKMRISLIEKTMLLEYKYLEDPVYLDMKSRASQCIENNYDIAGIFHNASLFISNFLTLLGLMYIITQLHFLMVVLIVLVVIINAYAKSRQARKNHFFRSKFSKIARKLFYIINVTWDYKYAKDIKAYNLQQWLTEKKQSYLRQTSKNSIRIFVLSTCISLLSILTSSIQGLIIYIYLVINVLNESLSIGDFSMFLAAVSNFSNSLSGIMNAYISISEASLYLFDYITFSQLETAYSLEKNTTGIPVKEELEIEFCDVSFSYPGQSRFVLEHISIKISQNEKVAIVGENGAGKSTLVKLIMRLYKPTSGKILLNGVDIQDIDITTYIKLISAVFQDYKILAFSIAENIAVEHRDDIHLMDTLSKVGLKQRVADLPNGFETKLSKEFDIEGTEFSGGEQQKVALAQAIYKNSQIVILDEPTSNLSPIAEYELYKQFNDLVSGKMALFISHRMSSCRFCDKIMVLDNGKIAEYGTHKELIQYNGIYADMFSTQAQYYTNAFEA